MPSTTIKIPQPNTVSTILGKTLETIPANQYKVNYWTLTKQTLSPLPPSQFTTLVVNNIEITFGNIP
jgi:hypothetical protein